MKSPPVNREIGDLAPIFRIPFLSWLAAAETRVPHVEFRVTETRRSIERQRWLYAQGREEPHLNAPQVTWTMDSLHRWGLAVDLAMIRRETGQAIWEVSSWQWLYRVCPLEPFGLTHIGPREWVHVEFLFAQEAIEQAQRVALVRS